ncbi:uncharacterized protein LOC123524900 isoform X1 [Mercenaria mercenaria]|uniref:uncharacterized protein LOC123524900 isoform X1 n=1 Tax=Mercenaria mercenaria TaxID=6596 RepID=UPI001E1D9C15|nr:uncharacterized protein LOC123524900 isoform X1 [Mercenaria mercenaria]
MATSETEYYNRLDLIVVRIGTVTARRLFEKRVVDLKPENEDRNTWTVDKFMDLKRKEIMHMRPKNTIKFHLYPNLPNERDYTKWDISTLVFVLTRVCELDDTSRTALDTFKDIRNYLDHLENPAVKLVTYQKKLADLKQNHDLCLRDINDRTFEAEQKKLFHGFEHEPLSVSDVTKFYHKKTKEQKEMKAILTNNQKDTKAILRKLEKLEERMGVQDFPPATERRDLDIDDDIVQQFVTFLSSCLPGAEESNVNDNNSVVTEYDRQGPSVEYETESIPVPDLPLHLQSGEDEAETEGRTFRFDTGRMPFHESKQ